MISDKEAQFKLGLSYFLGTDGKEDNAKALHWFKLAAKQGHLDAQSNIGIMYDNGYKLINQQYSLNIK